MSTRPSYHLRPLGWLATEVERIDDRNLAARLPSLGQPVELAAPIGKLNDLLARLEASFTRERALTADVSHELRTPLAGLRTMLEVTALAPRSVAEHREVVASAIEIVIQLGALVDNLLALAQLDHSQVELAEVEIGLHALVDECWQPHAALATSRSLVFTNRIPADAVARTDRRKLGIVVTNLLANAAAYTTPGGWVEASTSHDALLAVTDSGPPIPPDQLEQVFARLWRGDVARSSTGLHCGIGLALARSLCEQLALSLQVMTRADGAVQFTVANAARPAAGITRHALARCD